MGHILNQEADFRVLLVSLNALGTMISGEGSEDGAQKKNLYPNFGYLYPEGTANLQKAENEEQVRLAVDPYPMYKDLYEQVKSFYDKDGGEGNRGLKSIEDGIYKANVHVYEMAFKQQYHFGVFY